MKMNILGYVENVKVKFFQITFDKGAGGGTLNISFKEIVLKVSSLSNFFLLIDFVVN